MIFRTCEQAKRAMMRREDVTDQQKSEPLSLGILDDVDKHLLEKNGVKMMTTDWSRCPLP